MILASVLIYSAFAEQLKKTTTTTTTPHCEYGYKKCCWVNAPDGCGTDYLNSIAGDLFKIKDYDVSDFQLTHKPSGWVAVYDFGNNQEKPDNLKEESCKEVVKDLQNKCQRPNRSDIPDNDWNMDGCAIPSKINNTTPFFDGFENFNTHVLKYPKSCKASRPLCGRNKFLSTITPPDFQDCESNKRPAIIQTSNPSPNSDYINHGNAESIMNSDVLLPVTYLNCTQKHDCHIIIDFGLSDPSRWTVCKANLIEIVVVTESKPITDTNGNPINTVLTQYNDPLQGDVTFMLDNGGNDMPNWDDENWTGTITLDDKNNGFYPIGGRAENGENGPIVYQGSIGKHHCTSDRFCSIFIYVDDNVNFRFMKLKLFSHENSTIQQHNPTPGKLIEEPGKILLRDVNVTGQCDLEDSTTTSTTTSTATTTTTTTATTATTTTDGAEADDKEKNNILIYAVVGSCIGVAALGGSLLYYKKKKKKRNSY